MTKEDALLRLEERYYRLGIAINDAREKMDSDDPVLEQASDACATAFSIRIDLESDHVKMSDEEIAAKVYDAERAIVECFELCGWIEVEDMFFCCNDNDNDNENEEE